MLTNEDHARGARDYRALHGALNRRWAELCKRYLPAAAGAIWRYSRAPLPGDPEQGWKLHVSANVLTAPDVLCAVAPLLAGRGVLYKAPASLGELDKLNSGVFYGYSQVGKFITVYPRTAREAAMLAARLHRLTRGMEGPSVPFDSRYRAGGCVYYRYGAFKPLDARGPDGEPTYALRDPEGRLVPDRRDSAARPDWAADPFVRRGTAPASAAAVTPLQTTFKAFRALQQRGKGGVYMALDLSTPTPRLCVLKEGRKGGEVSWDGRDGFWRVEHESRVLEALRGAGLDVPRVYSSFRAERNYYLAAEFIEGEPLDRWLARRRRRLPVRATLKVAAELARLVAGVHAAGWVWRDCKPGNVVVTKGGRLRPLDFEGACPVDDPDPLPWGTAGYVPPEAREEFGVRSRLPEDLYALGAVVYLLLAGRPPEGPSATPLRRLRRDAPLDAELVAAELLDADPGRRPSALDAAHRLEAAAPTRVKARA